MAQVALKAQPVGHEEQQGRAKLQTQSSSLILLLLLLSRKVGGEGKKRKENSWPVCQFGARIKARAPISKCVIGREIWKKKKDVLKRRKNRKKKYRFVKRKNKTKKPRAPTDEIQVLEGRQQLRVKHHTLTLADGFKKKKRKEN